MEHDVDSPECWCHPEALQPCPECPVEPGNVLATPHCWKCGGRGLVPEFDGTLPTLYVHIYP